MGTTVAAAESTRARRRQAGLLEYPAALLPEHAQPPALRLIDEFALEREGRGVDLPHSARRLVAFLAVCGHPVTRVHVAGSLWPDVTEERAAGNLRSTLWRLRQAGADVVACSSLTVALATGVSVDLHTLLHDARACIDGGGDVGNLDVRLAGDLLPDWYDEWLVIERERLRQLRLHALEALCCQFVASGATGRAIDVGLSAVAVEPLRESAHRVLVAAHLAEGNAAEALRQYDSFADLVRSELGIGPSPAMEDLVRPLRPGTDGPRAGTAPDDDLARSRALEGGDAAVTALRTSR